MTLQEKVDQLYEIRTDFTVLKIVHNEKLNSLSQRLDAIEKHVEEAKTRFYDDDQSKKSRSKFWSVIGSQWRGVIFTVIAIAPFVGGLFEYAMNKPSPKQNEVIQLQKKTIQLLEKKQ